MHLRSLVPLTGWLIFAIAPPASSAPAGSAAAVSLGDFNTDPSTVRSLLQPGDPAVFVSAGERIAFSTRYDFPEGTCALWSYRPGAGAALRLAPSAGQIEDGCLDTVVSLGPLALLSSRTTGRIWRSDGTRAGTFPLTDSPGSFVDRPFRMTAGDGAEVVLFSLCGARPGCVLARTDGSRAGTRVLLADDGTAIEAGTAMKPWNGKAAFFGSSEGTPAGLWVSDGTSPGTHFLAAVGAFPHGENALAETRAGLVFTARDPASGREELWGSDGSASGTVRLGAFEAPPCPESDCAPILDSLHPVDGEVVFLALHGEAPPQLWHSDGTAGGTRLLTTLPDLAIPFLDAVLRVGSRWVILVFTEGGALQLWRVEPEGSPASPLLDCGSSCPGIDGVFSQAVQPPGRLLFGASDPEHGGELWVTDGTAAGSHLLADLCPGDCSSYPYASDYVPGLLADGRVYFRTTAPTRPTGEVWASDGTLAGTERIADTTPVILGDGGGRVYLLRLENDGAEVRLESTNGTTRGTRLEALVGPGRPAGEGADPIFLPAEKGVLLVSTQGGLQEVWRSLGSAQTTELLAGVGGPIERARFEPFSRRIGRWTYFTRTVGFGSSSPFASELWRSDGTGPSTLRLAAAVRGQRIATDTWTEWQGRLLYVSSGLDGDDRFWLSDGTGRGTRPLLRLPDTVETPTSVLPFGSRFLFVARAESGNGLVPQLFVSDGTERGTKALTAIEKPRHALDLAPMARLGNRAFFLLWQPGQGGTELWVTDGTPGGTHRVFHQIEQPRDLFVFRGELYFTTEGESGGTFGHCERRLVRWHTGADEPETLAALRFDDSHLFCGEEFRFAFFPSDSTRRLFVQITTEEGSDLWVTDGRPAGTRRLHHNGALGYWDGQPTPVLAGDGRLYFPGRDGPHGREVWVSDGTEGGTALTTDLRPGFPSSLTWSGPAGLALWQGRLFVAADDGIHGTEPWELDVDGLARSADLGQSFGSTLGEESRPW